MARLGPATATLEVHTFREGAAARVGHDLVLVVEDWQATVGDDAVELTADPRSFRVREGRGGVKPLTDGDRREILKNIAKTLPAGPIAFRSTRVTADAVEGELTLAGVTRPVRVSREGEAGGRATLRQSDWGIKPYRGLMGALKVRDDVEVVLS